MSGFRCYCVRWSDGTTYESSPLGVQACLKDIADKFLEDTSFHGFSLDTTNNPDGQPVKLVSSYGVYAICFVHTSGSRLMLALNFRGMCQWLNSGTYSPTIGVNTIDRCFGNKISEMATLKNSGDYTVIGGLMACYIPAKDSSEEIQETFDLTKDITDSNFFPDSAMNVVSTSTNVGATSTSSKTSTYGYYNANLGQSLIKVGTSYAVNYQFNDAYGAPASWRKSYSVLCDDKETIIVTSQCVQSTSINPPCRFAITGKIQNPETEKKGFSLQQHFMNTSSSRVGAFYTYSGSNRVLAEIDYDTERYDSGYLNASSYNTSTYACAMPMLTKNSWNYPVPYPLHNANSKTVDGTTLLALYPLSIAGGNEKIAGFISDNLRVMFYKSDLVHNTFFNNKEWVSLGYMMIFSGRSSLTSTVPSYSTVNTSTSVWNLLFRFDEGNTDSPFGAV